MRVRGADARALRLRLAFDLFEAGVGMRHQQIRRQHPRLDNDSVDALLLEWLHRRTDAEPGDSPGRVRAWPGLAS